MEHSRPGADGGVAAHLHLDRPDPKARCNRGSRRPPRPQAFAWHNTHSSETLVTATHSNHPQRDLCDLQTQVPSAPSLHRRCPRASRDLASNTDRATGAEQLLAGHCTSLSVSPQVTRDFQGLLHSCILSYREVRDTALYLQVLGSQSHAGE